jgi:predicted DNA-binding transcriptional regulator YafY
MAAMCIADLFPHLSYYFGERIHEQSVQTNAADDQGWIRMTLAFESLEATREKLLGLGRAIEVLEPVALRMSLVDFAKQIVAGYMV